MGSLVDPKQKTIRYVMVGEKRDQPFTREMELASLFTLAEARQKVEPLSAMAHVYYPLRIQRWEGGALLIDLLGLNQASIKYDIVPDLEGFEDALAAASDDPHAFREVLRRRGPLFKGFAGKRTVKIRGLIKQPKSDELPALMKDMRDLKAEDEPVAFKPVLKGGDIEAIIDSIYSLRGDLEGDLKRLERARRSMMSSLGVVRKVIEEEIGNIRDRSAKVKARMRKQFEKFKVKRRNALERELKKIRKEYGKQVNPLRSERTKLKRKLIRRKKKRDNLKAEGGDYEIVESLSREIEGIEVNFKEVDGAVRSLEAWRDGEVGKARARYKADLKAEGSKIREEEALSREAIKGKRAEIEELRGEVKGMEGQINALIRSKKEKLRSLSKLLFDVEAETTDLYIPFYIFQYGTKRYDFHPPVVVSDARGLLSRFKRIFADNLQSKMTMLIKPRTTLGARYLAKAVKALRRKTGLAEAYRKAGERLNLLRSREAVDGIMVGLVKIRREGWISDAEYIRLQGALVDNLGLISRP